MAQHESGATEGFTCRRLPFKIAFCLEFDSLYEAITAEKQIKVGRERRKKH